MATKRRVCPGCGGKKGFYAEACWKCHVHPKPLLGKTGPTHPAWRGGKSVDRDGYIRLYLPSHRWPRANGYVLEHVAVMENTIGRKLHNNEVVHHIDGNRQNNAISNLLLMERGVHSSLHAIEHSPRRSRDLAGRFS